MLKWREGGKGWSDGYSKFSKFLYLHRTLALDSFPRVPLTHHVSGYAELFLTCLVGLALTGGYCQDYVQNLWTYQQSRTSNFYYLLFFFSFHYLILHWHIWNLWFTLDHYLQTPVIILLVSLSIFNHIIFHMLCIFCHVISCCLSLFGNPSIFL